MNLGRYTENSDGKDVYEIEDVIAKSETEKAIRVTHEDGLDIWIPISQIDDDSEVYAQGDTGTLIISKWIAEQKGFI